STKKGGGDKGGTRTAGRCPQTGKSFVGKAPFPADKSSHHFRAEPEHEKAADHRGGNEEFAQRSGPASNERRAAKDQHEDDQREADLSDVAWHAQFPGYGIERNR